MSSLWQTFKRKCHPKLVDRTNCVSFLMSLWFECDVVVIYDKFVHGQKSFGQWNTFYTSRFDGIYKQI